MTNEIIIEHQEYDDFYIDRTGESLYSTGSITIDWGDGTTETTNNNTYSHSHNYHNFVYDNEGYQTHNGDITVTISGVEEIRDGFLYNNYYGEQFVDTVVIPNNITSIGDNFCYNQEHLHYLTLSNSLTTIGDGFCYGCYLSNGLELPDSLTSIGNNFCNVTGMLSSLTLPDNITTIGDNFCVDSTLTSFTIPNSIISIGDHFLNGCSLITGSIVIPSSVESIGHDFLAGCGMTSIIFENNSAIDGIPDYFACRCMNLTNISFPDNLETIGINFCCDCPSLTRVEFPEGLIEIGENFLSREEEPEPIHLNKLIFPSSFRYLNNGLLDASIDKVIFKSVIPVDMSAGYPEQFESMIIHVPKNCTDAYANAFTEAFGDYGEDSLSDPNHYRENLTLPETAAKFGTLMRTNLKRKGIETQRNDGLTTLINKVNDIETNDMTGFLADIGFYNTDNWSGAVTILKDKLIINDDSEFSFDNVDFPDTFTWSFVILPQNSEDTFGIGPNATIQPNDYNVPNLHGYIKYEEMMVISRENGGDFTVFFVISGDEYPISDLTIDYLSFSPATENPIVIQNIYFSEETYPYEYYDDYEKATYNAVFDRYSNIRPSTIPILLLKDNKLVDEYPINDNTKYLFSSEDWICYHFKTIDDTSQYSWIAPCDIGHKIMDTYSVVKHNINDNEEDRVDHYIECDELYGYDEPNTENITPWNHQMDSYYGSFDYSIQSDIHDLTKEWGLTFEYIRLSETNNNIGFTTTFHSGSGGSGVFFSLSDDKFHINIWGNVYSSDTLTFQDYNILTIYQEINDNQMLRWRVDMNHETVFVYDSSIDSNYADFCSLSMQCYQSNAQIRNFYYWNKKNQKFLFYDGCTLDKTSQYSTIWRTFEYPLGPVTLTYNSTEQAYSFLGTSQGAASDKDVIPMGMVIPNVRGEDDIRIRCKVKFKNNNVSNQFSIIISDSLYQHLDGNWDMFRVCGNGHTDHLQKNETKWESSVTASYVYQNYCYIEIIKQGTTIIYNLYDVNLDIINSATLTGLTYASPYFVIGLNGKYNAFGKFIKEILVQKI